MMDLNPATVVMLVQDAASRAFLQALYDQSAQLLTLSTATAAIFVALSDKNKTNTTFLWFGLGALVVSAVAAVWMMSRLTELMGKKNESYVYGDLSWNVRRFPGDGLAGLHLFHSISLGFLALGVLLFVVAKLTAK